MPILITAISGSYPDIAVNSYAALLKHNPYTSAFFTLQAS
jgi:hypothetical protein